MFLRPFWLRRIAALWQRRSIVWLSGVRRVGKTTLARQIEDGIYLNCDLPSTDRQLTDPEAYLAGLPAGATLILDPVGTPRTGPPALPAAAAGAPLLA